MNTPKPLRSWRQILGYFEFWSTDTDFADVFPRGPDWTIAVRGSTDNSEYLHNEDFDGTLEEAKSRAEKLLAILHDA